MVFPPLSRFCTLASGGIHCSNKDLVSIEISINFANLASEFGNEEGPGGASWRAAPRGDQVMPLSRVMAGNGLCRRHCGKKGRLLLRAAMCEGPLITCRR